MTDDERLAFLEALDQAPAQTDITDSDREAFLASLEAAPEESAPQPDMGWGSQQPVAPQASLTGPRPGLSLSEYFPSTAQQLNRASQNPMAALGPGGYISQIGLSVPSDILNAAVVKPAMTGIAQGRRISSGRPAMPLGQAYATEMRGGELPVNKEEATMRPITEGIIGALPFLASRSPVPPAEPYVEPMGGPKPLNLSRMRNPFKGLNDQEIEGLAQRVRQSFFGAKKAVGIEFDNDINSAVAKEPLKVIPETRPLIDEIKMRIAADPEFSQRIYNGIKRSIDIKNPEGNALVRFLKDPNLADNATATDVQQIKTTLESVPQVNRAKQRIPNQPYRAGGKPNIDVANVDLDIQEIADRARHSLLANYPELVPSYAKYSDFMNDFRMIRRGFTEAQLEGKLQQGFKTAEQREAARRVLPREIQDIINKSRKIEKGASFNRKAAIAIPTGIAAVDYARRLFKR